MRKQLALAAALMVTACTAMTPAYAQGQQSPACGDARAIAKQLSNKYDEAPVAFGMQSNGHLLQVYASEKKGTWTVVSTTPAGMSCIVAAGKHWEMLPPVSSDPLA